MALHFPHWTCGHCGWANFTMRINCLHCAQARPIAELAEKRLPGVERFTVTLRDGRSYNAVNIPRPLPWYARPKPKPDPALPAGALRGVEPSDDPIADMAEWAKKL